MTPLRLALTIIMVVISIILTIVILMQEGKSEGLGSLTGASNTYWGKNKGRSAEGVLEKFTTGLVACFFVLAVVLNMHLF